MPAVDPDEPTDFIAPTDSMKKIFKLACALIAMTLRARETLLIGIGFGFIARTYQRVGSAGRAAFVLVALLGASSSPAHL